MQFRQVFCKNWRVLYNGLNISVKFPQKPGLCDRWGSVLTMQSETGSLQPQIHQ